MIRWWNAGWYEQECAEFDAAHPLSREVWDALQRYKHDEFHRMLLACRPPNFVVVAEPEDPTEEWFRIRYWANIKSSHKCYNAVFDIK